MPVSLVKTCTCHYHNGPCAQHSRVLYTRGQDTTLPPIGTLDITIAFVEDALKIDPSILAPAGHGTLDYARSVSAQDDDVEQWEAACTAMSDLVWQLCNYTLHDNVDVQWSCTGYTIREITSGPYYTAA